MTTLSNFREAVKIEVMLVTVKEGEGTSENPFRLVYYYISMSGEILFSSDPNNPTTLIK